MIACSVPIREEYALRWVEQAVFGGSVRALTPHKVIAQAGLPNSLTPQPSHRLASLDLLPSAAAARRVPWVMRRAVSDFTSVAVHTGLLRLASRSALLSA